MNLVSKFDRYFRYGFVLLFKEKEMRRQQAVLLKHQVGTHSVDQTDGMPIVNYYLNCMGGESSKYALFKFLGLIPAQIFFHLTICCFALVLGSFGGL